MESMTRKLTPATKAGLKPLGATMAAIVKRGLAACETIVSGHRKIATVIVELVAEAGSLAEMDRALSVIYTQYPKSNPETVRAYLALSKAKSRFMAGAKYAAVALLEPKEDGSVVWSSGPGWVAIQEALAEASTLNGFATKYAEPKEVSADGGGAPHAATEGGAEGESVRVEPISETVPGSLLLADSEEYGRYREAYGAMLRSFVVQPTPFGVISELSGDCIVNDALEQVDGIVGAMAESVASKARKEAADVA